MILMQLDMLDEFLKELIIAKVYKTQRTIFSQSNAKFSPQY